MFHFMGKLWLKAEELAKDFCPDLVISSSTYPLDTYAARRIAKLSGAKYVHEGHDLWPLTLTKLGGMSEWHPFCLLMGMAERYAYSNANHVVSVLPNSVEHMLEHGLVSKERFTYIPNGIVHEDWLKEEKVSEEHKRLFDKLKAEGFFVVAYLGGHAISNALDTFINAARMVENEKIAFVLIGKGVEKERLIAMARGLKNVFFYRRLVNDRCRRFCRWLTRFMLD